MTPQIEPGALDLAASRVLLLAYDVPMAREDLAADAEGALSVADEIGYPVVVKMARPGVVHKTEAGGLVLRRAGSDQRARGVREAPRTIRPRASGSSRSMPWCS